jgi:hypothetical protein
LILHEKLRLLVIPLRDDLRRTDRAQIRASLLVLVRVEIREEIKSWRDFMLEVVPLEILAVIVEEQIILEENHMRDVQIRENLVDSLCKIKIEDVKVLRMQLLLHPNHRVLPTEPLRFLN